MSKTLQQSFTNVLTYAAGMQKWVTDLFSMGGHTINYTFAQDFAIADWMSGLDGVRETMQRIRSTWQNDYKAYAQAIASLSAMRDAHYRLKEQGIDGRDTFIDGYDDIYADETDHFYDIYANDSLAKDYLFELTD